MDKKVRQNKTKTKRRTLTDNGKYINFVLSIFEWSFKTGFTVVPQVIIVIPPVVNRQIIDDCSHTTSD